MAAVGRSPFRVSGPGDREPSGRTDAETWVGTSALGNFFSGGVSRTSQWVSRSSARL